MKDFRECGPTGKLAFTAEEADREIIKIRKAVATKFCCRVCHKWHLVIRRKSNDFKRSGNLPR
jgi:hypothetical protein